jgi:hypothetical protein
MGAASHASPDGSSRTKVFFKGFPIAIPRRLGVAWFEALYDKTNKEAGLQLHIGSNTSFAVSFPSADAAKRFSDQVRDDGLSLNYVHRGGNTTILMEQQYRSSVFGKAISSVWKIFSEHCTKTSTVESPLRLIYETNRGRIRAEMDDEVLLLGHIHDDLLVLNRANLDAVGFSLQDIEAISSAFVA